MNGEKKPKLLLFYFLGDANCSPKQFQKPITPRRHCRVRRLLTILHEAYPVIQARVVLQLNLVESNIFNAKFFFSVHLLEC